MIVQVKKADIQVQTDTRNLVLNIGLSPADENQHNLLALILSGDFKAKNTSAGDHLSLELIVTAKVPPPEPDAEVAAEELQKEGVNAEAVGGEKIVVHVPDPEKSKEELKEESK